MENNTKLPNLSRGIAIQILGACMESLHPEARARLLKAAIDDAHMAKGNSGNAAVDGMLQAARQSYIELHRLLSGFLNKNPEPIVLSERERVMIDNFLAEVDGHRSDWLDNPSGDGGARYAASMAKASGVLKGAAAIKRDVSGYEASIAGHIAVGIPADPVTPALLADPARQAAAAPAERQAPRQASHERPTPFADLEEGKRRDREGEQK